MNTSNENDKQSTPQSGSVDIGVVFRKTLEHYTVRPLRHEREIDCTLSSLLRKQLIFPTADPSSLRHAVQEVREIEHVDPVAIGDRVRFVKAEEVVARL